MHLCGDEELLTNGGRIRACSAGGASSRQSTGAGEARAPTLPSYGRKGSLLPRGRPSQASQAIGLRLRTAERTKLGARSAAHWVGYASGGMTYASGRFATCAIMGGNGAVGRRLLDTTGSTC